MSSDLGVEVATVGIFLISVRTDGLLSRSNVVVVVSDFSLDESDLNLVAREGLSDEEVHRLVVHSWFDLFDFFIIPCFEGLV